MTIYSTIKPDPNSPYEQLIQRVKGRSLLDATSSLLGWDQRTMMPPKGIAYRAEQLGLLATMAHEMLTDPMMGDLLGQCETDTALLADGRGAHAINLREMRRSYDRALRMPKKLIEQLAHTSAMAQSVWLTARKEDDFDQFRPWLEKLVDLQRQKADCLGWATGEGAEPWDALADDFDPGCRATDIEALFTPLRDQLISLRDELLDSSREPSEALLHSALATDRLKSFVRSIAESIGFDFSRGRLDESAHPFCQSTHCHDVRMTTRFNEPNPIEPLFSTIHETGHGIYCQQLPQEHIGTPMGSAVSLSIHESQSRMWENLVGRSRSFWVWCLPRLKASFDAVDLSVDDAYSAVNLVRPGLIRVEADEVTYNLHIMIRFEIERALISGQLEVADLPSVWKEKYKQTLGIDVPNNAKGCLQDIHWASDSIGYFPTYTLGNLYAAQFYEKAVEDHPDLNEQFERGEFAPLRHWLGEQIHRHGMRYRSEELCEHVTGEPLTASPLVRHLQSKLRPIYGL